MSRVFKENHVEAHCLLSSSSPCSSSRSATWPTRTLPSAACAKRLPCTRAEVRAVRIAGGRCYGYALSREKDASGRSYTVARIDQEQAAIVQCIYRDYDSGMGMKAIAR